MLGVRRTSTSRCLIENPDEVMLISFERAIVECQYAARAEAAATLHGWGRGDVAASLETEASVLYSRDRDRLMEALAAALAQRRSSDGCTGGTPTQGATL